MRKVATVCFMAFTMLAMSGCGIDTWMKGTIDRIAGNSTGAVSADIVSAVNSSNEDVGVVIRHSENIETKTNDIEESVDLINKENAKIGTITNDPTIRQSTETIREALGNIKQYITSIREMLVSINARLEEVKISNQEIINSNFEVEKLEEANRKLESEKEELANESKSNLYKTLYWFFGAGFVIAVAGGVVMIWERKIGMMIMAIGGVTIALAATSTFYLEWIALVGGITVGVAIFGSIGVLLWKYRKQLFETEEVDSGVDEIVAFVDKAVKPILTKAQAKKLFDDGGLADQYQSEATKLLVSKKRNTIDEAPKTIKKDKKTD